MIFYISFFQGENEKWGVSETAELAIATLQHVIASDFKVWLFEKIEKN